MIKDLKISRITETDNLLMVDLRATNFAPCHFVFTDKYITCFGDIASFTWFCSWNTKEEIKQGNCYTHDELYFASKLEHKAELKEFDIELFEKAMEELKKEMLSSLNEWEMDDYRDKWDENKYLLDKVDRERLEGFDEFIEEMEIDNETAYCALDNAYKLPYHYYIAVEMLQFIEDYFKNKKEVTE